MRSVAEHLAACLDIAQAAAPLDVVLLDAVGCVLAEDVVGRPGFVERLAQREAERWAWSRGSDAVGSALWRLRRS